jgi:hypothetical protein
MEFSKLSETRGKKLEKQLLMQHLKCIRNLGQVCWRKFMKFALHTN